MVRQQFGSHYSVHETGFQFDVDLQREPSITVDYERVSREQWTLTREGTFRQVFTLLIDYSDRYTCIFTYVNASSCCSRF